MKDFDLKWRAACEQARLAPRRDESAPWGLAARLTLQAGGQETAPPKLAWDRLSLRLLTGAVTILIFCLLWEAPHWQNTRPLEPGIENTVAQVIWIL